MKTLLIVLVLIAEERKEAAVRQRNAARRTTRHLEGIIRMIDVFLGKKPPVQRGRRGPRGETAILLPLIKPIYANLSNKAIAAQLGTSEVIVRGIASRYRLRKAPDFVRNLDWSAEQLRYLVENFRTVSFPEIARYLGKQSGTVQSRARDMGLKRTTEEQRAIERQYNAGCFKPGLVPANKGVKGRVYPGTVATQFKPGQLPKNTLSDGEITVRTDKRGVQMEFIRIALAKWVPLKNHRWEQAHGPVPKGSIVVFKTADTFDCGPGNLECITRADHAIRNKRKGVATVVALKHILKPEKVEKALKPVEVPKGPRKKAGRPPKADKKPRFRRMLERRTILSGLQAEAERVQARLAARQLKQLEAEKRRRQEDAERQDRKAASRRAKLEAERGKVHRMLHPHTPKEKLASSAQALNQGKVRVWIDHKTCVLVAPDRVEKVRAKYGLTA